MAADFAWNPLRIPIARQVTDKRTRRSLSQRILLILGSSEKQCKSWFQSWTLEASRKEIEMKNMKKLDAKGSFEELLKESITNWRTARFDDFTRRWKRDLRYTKFDGSKEVRAGDSILNWAKAYIRPYLMNMWAN